MTTGYEAKMYSDIHRAASALERMAVSVEKLAAQGEAASAPRPGVGVTGTEMVAGRYLAHVADLEEWNEEWDHEFGEPTVVRGADVVTVYHPLREGEGVGMVVASYTLEGVPLSLFVRAGREHDGTDYWGRS